MKDGAELGSGVVGDALGVNVGDAVIKASQHLKLTLTPENVCVVD